MSNTLSSTENHQNCIEAGKIYKSPAGSVCIVKDVLESTSGNVCLYVRFAHNIGNPRPYDMLELRDGWGDKMWNVHTWQPATVEEFRTAAQKRINSIQKEIDDLSQLVVTE